MEFIFDTLWTEESMDGIYDPGLTNDKLVLLFLENQDAKIAIKTVKIQKEFP